MNILEGDEVYLKVGEYWPECEDRPEKIKRQFYRQGWIYKNEYAYRKQPDAVCYIPELSDTAYTAEDFLEECNGQREFADELFDEVDWQHPETLEGDWFKNNEWGWCPKCEKLVSMEGEEIPCPVCGSELE